MKTLIAAAAALALLASPVLAGVLVTEDNPDVKNCTIVGPNTPDCENVLGKSIYPVDFGPCVDAPRNEHYCELPA